MKPTEAVETLTLAGKTEANTKDVKKTNWPCLSIEDIDRTKEPCAGCYMRLMKNCSGMIVLSAARFDVPDNCPVVKLINASRRDT